MAAVSLLSLVISAASRVIALPEKRSVGRRNMERRRAGDDERGIGQVQRAIHAGRAFGHGISDRAIRRAVEFEVGRNRPNPRLRAISGIGASGKWFRLTVTPQRGRRR